MTTSHRVENSLERKNGELATPLTPLDNSESGCSDSEVIESMPSSDEPSSHDWCSLEEREERRDVRLIKMADEIIGKVVGPMPARLFLEKYLVKTNSELEDSDELHRFRTKMQTLTVSTKKEDMYTAFVENVQPLCPLLQLRDTHLTDMKIFDTIIIRPGVCAYTDTTELALNDVMRPDIMLEFRIDPDEDPFLDPEERPEEILLRRTDKAKETLGQITAYAAAQQSAQFRTHIFSMFILPSYFRILRWDRAGMIVTEKIELTDSLLPEFFLRYSHATPEQQGVDVTVTKPSRADAAAAREALKLSSSANLVQLSVSFNKERYILGRETYLGSSKSPTGRDTKLFQAYSIGHKNVVFLKEAWRHASQEPEHEIYAKLHEKQVPHIATVLDGTGIADHVTHTQDLVKEKPSWAFDLPGRLRKYIHYRLVLKEVAAPLTTFSSTKHLVQVIRQAIIAHRKAYEETGILHRDISVNNVMIYNNQALLIDWDLSKSEDEDSGSKEIGRTGTWQFIAARLLLDVVTPPGPHNLTDDLESFVHLLTWMAFVYTASNLATKKPTSVTHFMMKTYEDSYQDTPGDYFGGEHKATHLLTGRKLHEAGFSSENLFLLLTTLTEGFAVRYARDPSQSSFWRKKSPQEIAKKDEVINAHKIKLLSISNSVWMIGVFDKYLNASGWPENDSAVHNKLGFEQTETTTDATHFEQTESTTEGTQFGNSRRRSRESSDDESRKKMKMMSWSGKL